MVQQVQAPCDWMVCTASPINGKSHRVTELNTGVTVGMELEPVRSEPPLPSSLAPLWGAQVTHVSQLSPCYMLEAIAPPHRGCEISVTPFSTQGECRGLTPLGRGTGFPLSRLYNSPRLGVADLSISYQFHEWRCPRHRGSYTGPEKEWTPGCADALLGTSPGWIQGILGVMAW